MVLGWLRGDGRFYRELGLALVSAPSVKIVEISTASRQSGAFRKPIASEYSLTPRMPCLIPFESMDC